MNPLAYAYARQESTIHNGRFAFDTTSGYTTERRQCKGATVDASNRAELVERYGGGYQAIIDALEDMRDDEWDARPFPDEWTVREIVHHLADSEMTSAIRLRMMIAEDEPSLPGYDQELFARKLYYGDRPLDASLLAFQAARASTSSILPLMSGDQWSRTANHSEQGRITVDDWLEYYANHAHDHADQIRRTRAAARL